tara:strand:+ start:380 stop:583 length:204 start_codon:yes stop_codon:yes gene_type:complete
MNDQQTYTHLEILLRDKDEVITSHKTVNKSLLELLETQTLIIDSLNRDLNEYRNGIQSCCHSECTGH